MPLVFACIAPHGGHLLLPVGAPGPVPECRRAMASLRESFRGARPDCLAVLTPHGIAVSGALSLGFTATGYGELDEDGGKISVAVQTDLDLAAAWADRAGGRGVSVEPLQGAPTDVLPLDWGVTIPLALLTPGAEALPTVVACPSRDLPRTQLLERRSACRKRPSALTDRPLAS